MLSLKQVLSCPQAQEPGPLWILEGWRVTWSNSRSATTSLTSLPPRECPGPGAAEDLPWRAQVEQYLESSEQEAAPQQGGRDGLPTGFIPGCPRAEPVCAVTASQLMAVPLGDDLPVGPTL